MKKTKKQVFELDFYGRKIIVENGELAKQADGAVLVRYNDTVILTAAVVSKNVNLLSDFFPLTVNYQEKLYSVGKIPGGFIKRESRPSEAATLAARMIDRPMRPLFPEGFKNEVQIISTVLSVDQDCSPEMTAMLASSLAVSISQIPFNGPIAGVKVGRVDGEFVINPTPEQLEKSDIDLTVAGTKDAINMVESSADQVDEESMLEALMFGHNAIKELIAFEEDIISKIGLEKMEYERITPEEELVKEIKDEVSERMDKALRIKDKLEKYGAIDTIKEETIEKYTNELTDPTDDEVKELQAKVNMVLSELEYDLFRSIVVKEGQRADGRAMDEIRPLDAQVDLLPRTHGSALFTRGETQALAITTLGALNEYQAFDGISLETQKHFMLHYNFPAFSVGETGRYGSPGRREIGHGALAERSLEPVLPSEEDFPYAIRMVSDILSSNGSTSMASVCGSTLALMDAGVPIKAPVAGVAMGLIKDVEHGKVAVMTDIQGLEDFLGDMDFKVAGTTEGITAIQMDIKIKGIDRAILERALEQARRGRLFILNKITEAIPAPRAELSKYAPKISSFQIDPDKIKDVIGSGGKTINKIIASTGVKIDLDETGTVFISSCDMDQIKKAQSIIELICKDVEVGDIYEGKVIKILENDKGEFGANVNIAPGKDGMIHISKLSDKRVEKVTDVVNVGDIVKVKVIKIDEKHRIDFKLKEIIKKA